MAITREQKENIIEAGKKDLKESKLLLLTDLKGVNVSDLGTLRSSLKEANATLKVIKKRLLKIILKDSGVNLDPTKLEGQMATIFARGDISDVAGPVYKFSKDHETFEIIAGIDLENKEEITREAIMKIGSLPGRSELMAQIVGSIAAPLRGLVYVLSEKSKK